MKSHPLRVNFLSFVLYNISTCLNILKHKGFVVSLDKAILKKIFEQTIIILIKL